MFKLKRPLYFPHHPSQFERQAGRDYSHCDATNIAFPDVFPLSLPKLWDELKYLPTSHEMRLRLERRSRKEGVLSPTTHKECQVIALGYSKYSSIANKCGTLNVQPFSQADATQPFSTETEPSVREVRTRAYEARDGESERAPPLYSKLIGRIQINEEEWSEGVRCIF